MIASEHPNASSIVKNLPQKYQFPQQMIQHGVVEPINFLAKNDHTKEHYSTMLHAAHRMCAYLSELPEGDHNQKYEAIRDELATKIENLAERF